MLFHYVYYLNYNFQMGNTCKQVCDANYMQKDFVNTQKTYNSHAAIQSTNTITSTLSQSSKTNRQQSHGNDNLTMLPFIVENLNQSTPQTNREQKDQPQQRYLSSQKPASSHKSKQNLLVHLDSFGQNRTVTILQQQPSHERNANISRNMTIEHKGVVKQYEQPKQSYQVYKAKNENVNYQDQIKKQKRFNPFSLKMLHLYFNYGIQEQNHGSFKKALGLLRQSQSLCKTLEMLYSNERLIIFNNMGLIYYRFNAIDKAEEMYEKALKIYYYTKRQNAFVSSLFNNIGLLYCSKKDYKNALQYINLAFDMDKRLKGQNHITIASRLTNLAAMMQYSHRYEEAQILLNQALRIKLEMYGAQHPEIAIAIYNLSEIQFKMGQLQSCIDSYQHIFAVILAVINSKVGEQTINLSKYLNGTEILLNGLFYLQDSDKSKVVCLTKALRLIERIFEQGKLQLNIKSMKQMLLGKLQQLTN